MAGLTRLPIQGRDILLYSNCDSDNGDRKNVTVWGMVAKTLQKMSEIKG
jgi:hypothetical protein